MPNDPTQHLNPLYLCSPHPHTPKTNPNQPTTSSTIPALATRLSAFTHTTSIPARELQRREVERGGSSQGVRG